MQNDERLAVKVSLACSIGILAEILILALYSIVYENIDSNFGGYIFTVIISVICFLAVPAISDSSPNVETSPGYGIAQGAAMIWPMLWIKDLDQFPVINYICFFAAIIFYGLGFRDIYKKNEWNGDFWKLALSLSLQSLYAFSFSTIGGFVIAVIYVLSGAGRRKKH